MAFCKICRREDAKVVPAQQPDNQPATEVSTTTEKPYFRESSRSLPTRTSSHYTDYRQIMQWFKEEAGSGQRAGADQGDGGGGGWGGD